MSNYVHFIVIPEKEDAMGKVFKYAHMEYSQFYNKKMRTVGHLFQGRFFSCVMDELYTLACARYIERNPVRAKMVDKPHEWEWSSAKTHCAMDLCDELGVNKIFDYLEEEQETWSRFVGLADHPDEIKQIRQQTMRGRPLEGNDFVVKLEKSLKRFLRLKPRGRPKKKVEK